MLDGMEDLEDQGLAPKERGISKQWLVTFTDLVSLMLTFFVLLFSMSSVKVDKWEQAIDALSQSLRPGEPKQVVAPTAEFNIGTIFRKRAINLDYLQAVLEETMAQDTLLQRSRLVMLADRLVIALPSDLLFKPGSAVMTAEAREAMFALGGVLRNIGNQIAIDGHSDPRPPEGGSYASNWELSVARAVAVSNAMRRAGYGEDLIAFGMGDARFEQLPKDLPVSERRAMARRVDIVVLPTVGID